MASDSILDAIRRDLLDGKPVADTLRKCILIGADAGSPELRSWATKELKGYENVEDLPAYRKPLGVIQVDAIVGRIAMKGHVIGPDQLPKIARDAGINNEVAIKNPISEVEAMYDSAKANDTIRLMLPGSEYIRAEMDKGQFGQNTHALYWVMGASAFAGILDNVKTTLAELLAELGAVMPDEQETPTGEQLSRALSVAVTGDSANISISAPSVHASGHGSVQGVAAGAANRDLVQSVTFTPESSDTVRAWLAEYTDALPHFDAGLQPLLTNQIEQVSAELDKEEPQDVVVTTLLGSLKTFAENAAAAAGAGAGTMGLTQLLAHWPF